MLKSLLLLFIWALILSMSSPSSSSLAHRHERSVRGARNAAMESPYASPRRHRLAANPFQEVGNLPRVTLPRFPPLDQERAALRDADHERQEALQETPSRRYRRVPRREEENRAVSPMISRVSVYTGNLPISRISRIPHTHTSLYTRASSHSSDWLSEENIATILESVEARVSEETQSDTIRQYPRFYRKRCFTRLGFRGRDEIIIKSWQGNQT
ncbi:hypothetical protein B0H13DRAFT_1888755 [Mycena leptocephala]|nr:hypothetical protein B0H13DRAFT_1888755 [Mycena leptocephala]